MKASDLVCSVRARIGDPNGVLVGTGTLLELINSAVCEHFELRPELYTAPKIVKLVAGSVQEPGCSNVVSVDVLTSEDGTSEYGKLRTVNEKASSLFTGRCGGKKVGGQTVPSSATLDPRMPGQFKVQPPVSKGQQLWARIYCVESPCAIECENSEVEVSCKNFEDLVTFVVSKLFVPGDTELNAKATMEREYYYKGNNARRQIGYQIKRGASS
jgi:hypothetical protein